MTPDFTFDEASHTYRDEGGVWLPSCSQIIQYQGLGFDYLKFCDEDKLDRKSKIGTAVHLYTDFYDMQGGVDPEWLTIETVGFYHSWIGFRKTSGFVPEKVSLRMLANVNGLRYGMEIDKLGMLGRWKALLDLKCSEATIPSWSIQTAGYEMGYRGVPVCGRLFRAVVRLYEDGRPGKLLPHENHLDDAQQFLSALYNVNYRIKHGYLQPPE